MSIRVEPAGAAADGGPSDGRPAETLFCDRCGAEAGHGDHSACTVARRLEPPRYCGSCARRLVVQVTPTGWTATCSRHGTLAN